MNEQTIDQIIDQYNKAVEIENRNESEYRRGKGIGIQRGIEKTLKALGYEIVYEESTFSCDLACDIVRM